MAEYIKRETALMKLMQDGCSAKNLQSISDIPGADVVPVVRCANCKHRMLDVIYGLVCNHSYGLRKIFHDSYCPYGEYQTNAGGGADG